MFTTLGFTRSATRTNASCTASAVSAGAAVRLCVDASCASARGPQGAINKALENKSTAGGSARRALDKQG
jgi:hypothetical protein